MDRADIELHDLLDEYLYAVGQGDLLSSIRVVRELIAAAIFRQSDLLDEAGDAGFEWDDITAAVGADADRAAPEILYTFLPPTDRQLPDPQPSDCHGPGEPRDTLHVVPPVL